MKRILLYLFLSLVSLKISAGAAAELIDSANTAFSKKDYQKAITLYEKVRAQGLEAPALYFNLGDAYFKKKNIPMAILHFERSKKLQPGDDDTGFNLKTANALIVDKVEGAQVHLLATWENRFYNQFSEKGWCILSIVSFTGCLLFLLFYFISNRVRTKQYAFTIAFLFLLASSFNFMIARKTNITALTHDEAIVMAPQIKAKGSPDDKGTDLFILHEGTKVSVVRSSNGWSEVKLANGNTGWLPAAAFEVI